MSRLLSWLTGPIIEKFTGPLVEAYRLRLSARNDSERLEVEKTIAQLESARDIALAEAHDRFSATRMGRSLIVVPYGIWWATIYLVQIANPWIFEPCFGVTLVVYDVPPQINEMAKYLVPAIVLGDATVFAAKKFKR
jgi:hypothetical protein